MPPRRRAQCILAVFGGPQKYLHPHLATDRVPGQCQGSMGIGYCTFGANLARLKNRPRFPRKRMEERDRAGRWVSLPMKKGRRVLVESKTKLKINHWRVAKQHFRGGSRKQPALVAAAGRGSSPRGGKARTCSRDRTGDCSRGVSLVVGSLCLGLRDCVAHFASPAPALSCAAG